MLVNNVEVKFANTEGRFVDPQCPSMYEVFNYLNESDHTIIEVNYACIAKIDDKVKSLFSFPDEGGFVIFSREVDFAGNFGDYCFYETIEDAISRASSGF